MTHIQRIQALPCSLFYCSIQPGLVKWRQRELVLDHNSCHNTQSGGLPAAFSGRVETHPFTLHTGTAVNVLKLLVVHRLLCHVPKSQIISSAIFPLVLPFYFHLFWHLLKRKVVVGDSHIYDLEVFIGEMCPKVSNWSFIFQLWLVSKNGTYQAASEEAQNTSSDWMNVFLYVLCTVLV